MTPRGTIGDPRSAAGPAGCGAGLAGACSSPASAAGPSAAVTARKKFHRFILLPSGPVCQGIDVANRAHVIGWPAAVHAAPAQIRQVRRQAARQAAG